MYHASSQIPISRSKFCQERWIWGWSFWNEVPSTMPTESACPAQKGMGILNFDFHMFFDTIVCLITFFESCKAIFFCVLAIYLSDTMRHSFHILVTGHVGGSRRLPSHQTLVSPLGFLQICSHVGSPYWATIPSWPIKCCSQSSSLAVRITNR